MPVAAAIAGAAVIGGVTSTIASNKAANTAKDNAAASNALQSQIYQQNAAALSPYQTRGNAAGNAINSLLGLGGTASSSASAATPDYAGYVAGNPDLAAEWGRLQGIPAEAARFGDAAGYGKWHYDAYGAEGRSLTPTSSGQPANNGADTAASAFDAYKNGTEYQSRLQQGQNSVTAALGSKGLLDSGAALKSLTKYGQTFASNEFGNYLGYLQGQQGAGLSAASAQAGVGQNYANATSANNAAATNTAGNAALSNASTVNSALGNLVTAYGYSKGVGSSYGGLK